LSFVTEKRPERVPVPRWIHSNLPAAAADQAGMYQTSQEAIDEVAEIIAEAARLPLYDAAYALWRQMSRLDRLDGRPTEQEVRINRALSREEWWDKYTHEREHAYDGPMFGYLKRAFPRADDSELKQAIIKAVSFDDDCATYFKWEGDFWDCVVRAVAQAQKHHPYYLDASYRDARNYLAYLMK
jgi:hypothetical protein